MPGTVNPSHLNHEVQRYLQAVNDPSKVIRANGKIENKVWAAIKDFFTRLFGQEPKSTKLDASVTYISNRLTSQLSYKGVDLTAIQTLMDRISDRAKVDKLPNLEQNIITHHVQQIKNAVRLQGLSDALELVKNDLKNPDKLDLNFYKELLPSNKKNTSAMVNYESLEKAYQQAYEKDTTDRTKQNQARSTLMLSLQFIQGDLENQIDNLKK